MKITVATIVFLVVFGAVTSVHAANCMEVIQSSLQHFGAEPADAQGERSVCGNVRCVMSRESAFFIEQIEGTRASYIKVTKVINNQAPVAEYFKVERQNSQNCAPSDLKRIAKPGHTNALAAETANFFGLLGLGSLVTGVALDAELEEKGFGSHAGVLTAMGVLEDCPEYQKAGGSIGHEDYDVVVTTGGSRGDPTSFSFLAFLAGPACFAQAIAQEVRNGIDIEDSLRPGGGLADDGGVTFQAPDRIDNYGKYFLRKEGLAIQQEMDDGSTVTIDSAEVHISAKTNTRKKTRFEGVRKMGDKSQPFFMETVYQDYRQVPGSALYLPYRQILKNQRHHTRGSDGRYSSSRNPTCRV